jgi:hypothetical protein
MTRSLGLWAPGVILTMLTENPSSGSEALNPGRSTLVRVLVTLNGDAPPGGSGTLRLNVSSYGGRTCIKGEARTCSITRGITVARIDLDVDSNNDGTITEADDAMEGRRAAAGERDAGRVGRAHLSAGV